MEELKIIGKILEKYAKDIYSIELYYEQIMETVRPRIKIILKTSLDVT